MKNSLLEALLEPLEPAIGSSLVKAIYSLGGLVAAILGAYLPDTMPMKLSITALLVVCWLSLWLLSLLCRLAKEKKQIESEFSIAMNPESLSLSETELMKRLSFDFSGVKFDDSKNYLASLGLSTHHLARLEEIGYIKYYSQSDTIQIEPKGRAFLIKNRMI